MKKGAEKIPVFRAPYGLERSTQEGHVVAFQNAGVGEGHGQVQAGLASQCRQDTIRPLPLNDSFQDLHGERLYIYTVCDALVGHDGGRIGIDQDGVNTLLAKGFASLGASVIKLGSLPNNDGAGPDH